MGQSKTEDSFAKTDTWCGINYLSHFFLYLLSFFLTGGDLANELVRHFLIECTQKGVRLKGCPNEPYFGEYLTLLKPVPSQLVCNSDISWLFSYTAQSARLQAPYCPLLVYGALYHWLVMPFIQNL